MGMYLINVLSICFGMFILGSFKSWGEEQFTNDEYLSMVASVGSIFGALRFFWSFLLDIYSIRLIYGIMISL